ncbi:MAG: hypothetical protein CL853_10065 [Crocinitomicaceae bacterium]|nr:hypothetical protein [Crocinitomicaceae bacterium]
MKKILLSFFMLAVVGVFNAQIYTANDTTAFATWTAYDLDGDTYGWTVADLTGSGLTLEAQGGCVLSNSWSGAAGVLTPDNVLVSPAIDLSGVAGASLSWACGSVESTASGWFEESYAVYVFDATAIGGLMTGTFPTPIFDGTLTAGEVMEAQSFDISSFAGQSDIYIAIRHYNCTDENFIVFDDVVVDGSSVGTQESLVNDFVAYPNPANDVLNISGSTDIQSISIIGIDGKIISNQQINDLTTELNVSNLVSGVYFYEITTKQGARVRNSFIKK